LIGIFSLKSKLKHVEQAHKNKNNIKKIMPIFWIKSKGYYLCVALKRRVNNLGD
jgi:hypothetical protein